MLLIPTINKYIKHRDLAKIEHLSDPSNAVLNLVTIFSLSLLFLASSILFFHMARSYGKSQIPKKVAIFITLFLIFMDCILCIHATFEYRYTLNEMEKYCESNKSNCIFNHYMLKQHIIFYSIFSLLFIFINVYISFVLYQYS
jgi:hypothetical protein